MSLINRLRIGKVQIFGNECLIKEQIKSERSSKNACYHSLQNLLSCRHILENVLQSKNDSPACCFVWVKTWSPRMGEELRMVFENRVLRKASDRNKGNGRPKKNEHQGLDSSPNVIRITK